MGSPTPMTAEDARAAIEAGMTGGPSSDEFFTAAAAVGDYMADHCGYQVINVTATDDGFEGIPSDVEPGKTLIRLANNGTEFHEVALQRVRAGETRTVVELSPGRYAALCYVATGATPAAVTSGDFEGTSPSHAMKGMVGELQVL